MKDPAKACGQNLTIVRNVEDLRKVVAKWRAEGLRLALIPTMGALHHGHLSLIRLAKTHVDRVVVSIFVNPMQFGPHEDFERYPRQEAEDAAKLREVSTDLLYAPGVDVMYPKSFATTIHVAGVTEGLCGALRPGHFDGVTTVVAKLLLQCLPDIAIFGEKDYQQFIALSRLCADLDIPAKIMPGPIIRESDGLATSSRNVYLTAEERRIAVTLSQVLRHIANEVSNGSDDFERLLSAGAEKLIAAGFRNVEYIEIRDSETLKPVTTIEHPARVLAAAWLGKTRLIDNMAISRPPFSPPLQLRRK
jgi:pantoate--beta-alanine ligase